MSQDPPVYEMLWDCKYCGQKKLLGLTHRFCAGCGAPQDPAARYFPSDADKVAVHNHAYVGADLACPACRQPMARRAACCTNCGSPLAGGAEVARRADVVMPPPGGAPFAAPVIPGRRPGAPAKSSGGKVLALVGGALLLFVVLLVVALSWKREGAFEVTGHTWERSIAVERFERVDKRVWCDDVPSNAKIVSRRKEQRGTTEEERGETCVTRKEDLGNGAFKEVQDCKPKLERVPKMEDRCEIEVAEWRKVDVLSEKGESLADAPRWPVAKVSGGACIGCEREGERTEVYVVEFVDVKGGSKASCEVPEADWAGFAKGSKWKGKVRALTGGVDCAGLVGL